VQEPKDSHVEKSTAGVTEIGGSTMFTSGQFPGGSLDAQSVLLIPEGTDGRHAGL
jgi:hypothetical protein